MELGEAGDYIQIDFLIQRDIVFLSEKFQTVRKQREYPGKTYIWKCYFVLKNNVLGPGTAL